MEDQTLQQKDHLQVLGGKSYEQNFLANIEAVNLFDILAKNSVDLEKVISCRKEMSHFMKFNIILLDLHKTNKMNILASTSILVDEYFEEPKDLLKCLDENNTYLLRKELLEKFPNPKRSKNAFSQFMYS